MSPGVWLVLLVAAMPVLGWRHAKLRCYQALPLMAAVYQLRANYLRSAGPWLLLVGTWLTTLWLTHQPCLPTWYLAACLVSCVAYRIGQDLAIEHCFKRLPR